MNLAAQIRAAANSAQPAAPSKRHPRLDNLLLGGPARSAQAFADYEAVMKGRGWMTQRQIEDALGYAHTASTPFLKKLLEDDIIERRNKGGAPVARRSLGYEWRWKL